MQKSMLKSARQEQNNEMPCGYRHQCSCFRSAVQKRQCPGGTCYGIYPGGGTVKPVFNNYILAEYDAVLRREKFGFDASRAYKSPKKAAKAVIWF